jgi:aspartate/tyrosine/aromatic aminotransferase
MFQLLQQPDSDPILTLGGLFRTDSRPGKLDLGSERTGCAFVLAQTARESEVATAQMTQCARVLYSMPPDHGAAIVRTICEDPALLHDWWNELEAVRVSMGEKRMLLAKALGEGTGTTEFDHLSGQNGTFSLLKLSPAEIETARLRYGLYMVQEGRINLAGLPLTRIPDFVNAILAIQGQRDWGKSPGCRGGAGR